MKVPLRLTNNPWEYFFLLRRPNGNLIPPPPLFRSAAAALPPGFAQKTKLNGKKQLKSHVEALLAAREEGGGGQEEANRITITHAAHTLQFRFNKAGEKKQIIVEQKKAPTVISPPLFGRRWFMTGFSNFLHHLPSIPARGRFP